MCIGHRGRGAENRALSTDLRHIAKHERRCSCTGGPRIQQRLTIQRLTFHRTPAKHTGGGRLCCSQAGAMHISISPAIAASPMYICGPTQP